MKNIFLENLSDNRDVLGRLESDEFNLLINDTAQLVFDALKNGRQLFFCGNGGSAAESQHMAAEYVALLDCKNYRPGYRATALTTDTSFMTAWSNDFVFDDIYSRQLETFAEKKDVLFLYSTSGNSQNIVNACKTAKQIGMTSIGLLGHSGGKVASICDVSIVIPSNKTARIQEAHTLVGHSICEIVEHKLKTT